MMRGILLIFMSLFVLSACQNTPSEIEFQVEGNVVGSNPQTRHVTTVTHDPEWIVETAMSEVAFSNFDINSMGAFASYDLGGDPERFTILITRNVWRLEAIGVGDLDAVPNAFINLTFDPTVHDYNCNIPEKMESAHEGLDISRVACTVKDKEASADDAPSTIYIYTLTNLEYISLMAVTAVEPPNGDHEATFDEFVKNIQIDIE